MARLTLGIYNEKKKSIQGSLCVLSAILVPMGKGPGISVELGKENGGLHKR
jgi:hypothetical protein